MLIHFIIGLTGEKYKSLPLRPKYLPQHPILKHPQLIFFPKYGRPNFTRTENNLKLQLLRCIPYILTQFYAVIKLS